MHPRVSWLALLVSIAGWCREPVGAASSLHAECLGHKSHEECETFTGCEWNEVAFACQPIGAGHPCESILHRDECDHRKDCIYAELIQHCRRKDAPMPCDRAHTQHDCTALQCKWHHETNRCHGFGKPTAEECAAHMSGTECYARIGCNWMGAVQVCGLAGQSLHPSNCPMIFERSKCSGICRWDIVGSSCVAVDHKVVCEHVNSADDCATHDHCEYIEVEGHKMCHRKEVAVGCHRLYSEKSCKSVEHCEFDPNRGTCHKTGTNHRACSFHHNDAECRRTAGCEWDTLASFCKTEGMKVSCERYHDDSSCEQGDDCSWKRGICVHSHDVIECSTINSQYKCSRLNCVWTRETEECEEPPTPKARPVIPKASPDEALEPPKAPSEDCTKIKCDSEPSECPDGMILGRHSRECCKKCGLPYAQCNLAVEREDCPSDTCEWNQFHYYCGEIGAPTPCEHLFEEPDCKGESKRCTWHEHVFACTEAGEPVPCEMHFDKKGCDTDAPRCVYHKHIATCWPSDIPLPCKRYHAQKPCEEGGDGECVWDPHSTICLAKGEYLPCKNYYSKFSCDHQAERCSWNAPTERCLEPNEKPLCELLKPEAVCLSNEHNHCEWDDQGHACFEKHQFHPLDCKEHVSRRSCMSEDGCDWIDGAHSCANEGEHLPCKMFPSEEQCFMQPKCHWDEGITQCLEEGEVLECNAISSNVGCDARPDCTWHMDVTPHFCSNVGEVPTCKHRTDHDECLRAGCWWSEQAFHCQEKGELPPCRRMYDVEHCTARADDCYWSESTGRCLTIGEKVTCAEHYNKVYCEDDPDCVFYPTTDVTALRAIVDPQFTPGTCTVKGNDFCAHIKTDSRCRPKETRGQCAWDVRNFKCRKLLVRHDEL